jgi:hypothetical protein
MGFSGLGRGLKYTKPAFVFGDRGGKKGEGGSKIIPVACIFCFWGGGERGRHLSSKCGAQSVATVWLIQPFADKFIHAAEFKSFARL